MPEDVRSPLSLPEHKPIRQIQIIKLLVRYQRHVGRPWVYECSSYKDERENRIVQGKDSQDPSCIKRREVVVRLACVQQDACNQKPGQRKKKVNPCPSETEDSFCSVNCGIGGGNEWFKVMKHHENDRQSPNSVKSPNTIYT